MATDNSEEMERLNESLRQVQENLNRFGQSLGATADAMPGATQAERELADASKGAADQINKTKDNLKAFGGSLLTASKETGSALMNTSAGLGKYNGAVAAFGNTAGIAAKSLGALAGPVGFLVTVITKLVGASLEFTDNVLKAHDSLGDLGATVGTSTDDLIEMGRRAGYSSEQLGILTKHAGSLGNDLLALGGSTSQGVKAFSEIAAVSVEQREQFRNLGLSQEQVTEMQAKYVSQLAQTGGTLAKTPKELREESVKYIEQLNLLSSITGVSAKKQQEALDKALAQENFAAYIRSRERDRDNARTEEEKKAIQLEIDKRKAIAADVVATEGSARATAKLQLLATENGEVLTEQTAALAMTGELDGFRETLVKTKDANVGVTEAVLAQKANSIAATKQFEEQFKGYIKLGGALGDLQKTMGLSNDDFKNLAKNEKMMAELEGKSKEEQDAIFKKYAEEEKARQAEKQKTEDGILVARNKAEETAIKAREVFEKNLQDVNKGVLSVLSTFMDKLKAAIEWVGKFVDKFKRILGFGGESEAAPATPAPSGATTAAAPAPSGAKTAAAPTPTTPGAPKVTSTSPTTAPIGGAAPTTTPGGAAMMAPKMGRKAPSGPLAGQADLLAKLSESGITDKRAQANILAQVKAESGGVAKSESLKYSPDRLLKTFPKYFKDLADAEAVVAQGEEAIGNRIYGGRMGNTAEEGYKYRGRGLIQLTGKANYEKFGKLIGVDLVKDPDLANDPDIAQKLAVEYFKEKSKKFDLTDIAQVGKAVGYVDRSGEETAKRSQYAQSFMEQIPQAAGGGIFKGPDSGYLVEQHGMELTAPLNPESILMQLAKTPASETSKPSEAVSAAATSGMMQNNGIDPAMFADFMEMMQTKFDEMIAKLAQSNETQDKLLTYSMV